MTTMEAMETEQFISSVFSLPKKCYPRFNNLQKQLLSVGQRFQVTLEKFHKLTQTEVTEDLYEIKQTVKDITDTPEVQVAIFGKFHDDVSSHNLVAAKDWRYLTPDCVPSRLIRNECTDMFMQSHDGEGKPVAYVYIIYVDEIDNLQELAVNIQKDIEFLGLPSFKNLLLLVGLDPSLEREDSALESFETALRNIFYDTTEGEPYDEFHVFFKSCTYKDFVSSEGELPKLIQLHLEWKVIQPLQDMKELTEANFHTYRKNSEETFQGPAAVKESLQERLLETFKNDQLYILDALLGKCIQLKGEMDRETIVNVLLESFTRVLQCLMVEVIAKIYGIKEYHLFDTLFKEMEFTEECRTIIEDWIKKDIIPSLPPCFIKYPCANLKKDEEKTKFRKLFSKAHHETFFNELKKMVDKDLMNIVCRVHEELEKRFMATERNLAIQQKLKFEIESILKQTVASNYESYCKPSRANLTTELKEELLRIQGVEGVAVVCGELQVHVSKFQSSDKEKAIFEQIHDAMIRCKYWQKYKVGVITKKPVMFYSVGKSLVCPILNRRGTLGGFMTDFDDNLYCLTCAHVVPNNTDILVEIGGQQGGPIVIGQPIGVHGLQQALNLSVDAVDITAVKVNADQKPRCIPFFKTTDGVYEPSEMVPPLDRSLGEHHHVYKWGATTNLTQGILHTGDYNSDLFSNDVIDKYTYILVEPLPVDDDVCSNNFAQHGDSGAIVCAEREDNIIQTIGMVQGGDFKVKTVFVNTKYAIGFYLWAGIDKLVFRSGVYLNTVTFSEEKLRQIVESNQMPV